MYLGRHYIKKGKWIAAINRFKVVTKDYDQTVFIEEALHRLVEINYKLGLIDESQKYANILGYNYLSSEWYKKSYKVFNKSYKIELEKAIKKDKKDKKGVLKKFKKLFD
jgi:outer membrane protein assembly factor BamD